MQTQFAKAVAQALQPLGNAQRAAQQQAYAKSEMPYYGITQPILRRTLKDLFKRQVIEHEDAWIHAVLDLWRSATRREERYAAIELFGHNPYRKRWLSPTHFDVLKELISTGAWWDYVDALAANHAYQLMLSHPIETTKLMRTWARHEDLWLRRTSIICQLKRRVDTDEALLQFAIEGSIADKNFFARKAIGWALREYSKTNPDWVRAYVAEHTDALSPLSQREALKILNKSTNVKR